MTHSISTPNVLPDKQQLMYTPQQVKVAVMDAGGGGYELR